MNITTTPPTKIQKRQELKSLKPGDVFHYASNTFEEAISESLIWMRVDAPEAKDRVRVVNLTDGRQQERDGDHPVCLLQASMQIVNPD